MGRQGPRAPSSTLPHGKIFKESKQCPLLVRDSTKIHKDKPAPIFRQERVEKDDGEQILEEIQLNSGGNR